jgi:hypothetical protein
MTFRAVSQGENMLELQRITADRVCLCICILTSLVSMGLREWAKQIRARVHNARNSGIEKERTGREIQLAKIAEAKPTCIAYALGFLVGVLEVRPRKSSLLETGLCCLQTGWVKQDLTIGTLTVFFPSGRTRSHLN